VYEKNAEGYTVLEMACHHSKDVSVVEYLLSVAAQVVRKDTRYVCIQQSQTLMHSICRNTSHNVFAMYKAVLPYCGDNTALLNKFNQFPVQLALQYVQSTKLIGILLDETEAWDLTPAQRTALHKK
jgi:ankyrin repeat protein